MPARHPDAIGVDVIRTHAVGLADVIDAIGLDRGVPTCGDWTTADLVWHVCEVHDFWSWVIEHRPAGPDGYAEPERPATASLTRHLRAGADRLSSALDDADPNEVAWSWSEDETVGFTIRRQSHEALIHHVDGQIAAGSPTAPIHSAIHSAIDPALAADGVDEVLGVFVGGVPSWATFRPGEQVVRLDATDTGDSWTVRLGTMVGTSPASGRSYELDAVAECDDPPGTILTAPASGLDLWLWGRADESVITVTGDRAVARALRSMIADAAQ